MNIAVYCGSSPGKDPRLDREARALGAWIAGEGHALVYGGSSVGLMGAISRAALDAGGRVYGVEPQFFIDAGVAQHDLTELFVVEDMGQRKAKMIELADAFVAFPGGVGTLEEISEILSRIRLGMGPAECYFLNIGGFWNPLRELFASMLAQGFIAEADHARFLFPDSLDELTRLLGESQRHPRACVATATELATSRPSEKEKAS